MKIGLLIIGSEVLDGKITDLNIKILADFLKIHHLEITEALIVRDHKAEMIEALKALFEHNDLIVTSGGLGPTKDDITKETIAEFMGRKIIFSEEAFQVSTENYARFERVFPGKNHGYSYLPEGFMPLGNSTGFAPGFMTKHSEKVLFSGPGVPREFRSMLHDHLTSIIQDKVTGVLKHVIVRTRNIPEEKIFNEVDPTLWERLEHFGEVSSLPILMGVDIGIKIKALSEEEAVKKSSEILEIFMKSPVSKNIWNIGQETIEEKIIRLSNAKNIKFGFAESATGGLCSHRITGVSGSSKSFMGSVVCYDEGVKKNLLGVSESTLKQFQVVSPETAREMARGLQEKFNLDIAISITGYAGPAGGTTEFPVGSVCIGKALRNGVVSAEVFKLKGDRDVLKQRFSQAALYALLDEVEKLA